MIYKACHGQTLCFKAAQRGLGGLVSAQTELI